MTFYLKEKKIPLGSITDQYADFYLHVADEEDGLSIIKANKVILASQSKYFHRIFQSCENIQIFHMGLLGFPIDIIQCAIKYFIVEEKK